MWLNLNIEHRAMSHVLRNTTSGLVIESGTTTSFQFSDLQFPKWHLIRKDLMPRLPSIAEV
jgi:hypothetical protein